jgi:hypothetical protein
MIPTMMPPLKKSLLLVYSTCSAALGGFVAREGRALYYGIGEELALGVVRHPS